MIRHRSNAHLAVELVRAVFKPDQISPNVITSSFEGVEADEASPESQGKRRSVERSSTKSGTIIIANNIAT